MSLSVRDYLKHILDETEYLERNSAGLEKEAFLADETLKCAFKILFLEENVEQMLENEK